jgi:hypothetical protein
MTKSTYGQRDRAANIQADNTKYHSQGFCAQCVNKIYDCRIPILVCAIAICVLMILLITGLVIGIIIYEVADKDSGSKGGECDIVSYKNVYVGDVDKLSGDCIEFYNISKILTVGKDITLISDCQFEIGDDDNQLILNKLNDTSAIIGDWVSQGLSILVTDKDNNGGPAVIFAYLLYIGYSFEDASALIDKIPNVDIMYNFMQQINIYAYSITTGAEISEYEQKLLWSNTDNIVNCHDM